MTLKEERKEKILEACKRLPQSEIDLLGRFWSVSDTKPETVCERIAEDMSQMKAQLYVTSILMKLFNDTTDPP